jgi:hypothetical protein
MLKRFFVSLLFLLLVISCSEKEGTTTENSVNTVAKVSYVENSTTKILLWL